MADNTVNTQMQHPNGDVKVVPNELVDQYTERGWKKTSGSSKTSSTSSSK